MKSYTSPVLTDLGDVSSLTAADQSSQQVDQILDRGQTIGESVGSLDACIAPNPMPGGTCE